MEMSCMPVGLGNYQARLEPAAMAVPRDENEVKSSISTTTPCEHTTVTINETSQQPSTLQQRNIQPIAVHDPKCTQTNICVFLSFISIYPLAIGGVFWGVCETETNLSEEAIERCNNGNLLAGQILVGVSIALNIFPAVHLIKSCYRVWLNRHLD